MARSLLKLWSSKRPPSGGAELKEQMMKQNKNIFTLTGLVLFGGASMFACTSETPQEAPAPTWQQNFEPVSVDTKVSQDVAAPKKIETPKPVVSPAKKEAVALAIAHTEDIDYEAQALSLVDQGEPKKALIALRKHLHTAKQTPDLLLALGRLAREVRQVELAEQALKKGIALDTTRGELAVELARVYLDAGRSKKAERAARRALRANREDASAWNQLGRAAMAQSRWELAEVAYGRAIHLEPVDGLIQNNLGLLYVYMKNGPKAVNTLERAVELLDDSTPYYVFNNLGLAHELVGQNEEAREAFEEALLLNPFYTRAKVNLDRIEKAIEAVVPAETEGA
ncbi:MAG: tetratricopeptide repeat protein [Myxococcota bacterium]